MRTGEKRQANRNPEEHARKTNAPDLFPHFLPVHGYTVYFLQHRREYDFSFTREPHTLTGANQHYTAFRHSHSIGYPYPDTCSMYGYHRNGRERGHSH